MEKGWSAIFSFKLFPALYEGFLFIFHLPKTDRINFNQKR
jgi:hypothetical protein